MPSKAETIKPVMAWAIAHGNNLTLAVHHTRALLRKEWPSAGGDAVRVEIRDAATAKLERAVIEAAIDWAVPRAASDANCRAIARLAEAVEALQSKKVRK